jgi:glycosyltransferase involved in cell wall biosynthesis
MTLEQIVYRKADRFIVLSDAFRRTLVSEYGVANSDIRTVPGGVEANRFDPPCPPAEARERLGWPLECPIVLSVRRLVRRVGLKTLVEAMQDVVRCVPNVRLLIAGDGPLADELQNQIDDLDLDDHVELLGFVPDDELPLAYRAADVSIVPTRALEGFGLVAVESLAAGTPVLVTPVGGLPEVVRDLSGDLIMESSSTQAISDHLTAALNGSLPLPTADTCRSFAASHYDWPVIARQVRSVYEEVL